MFLEDVFREMWFVLNTVDKQPDEEKMYSAHKLLMQY